MTLSRSDVRTRAAFRLRYLPLRLSTRKGSVEEKKNPLANCRIRSVLSSVAVAHTQQGKIFVSGCLHQTPKYRAASGSVFITSQLLAK